MPIPDASEPERSAWNIRGRRVIITGGNAGIGKAAATELLRRGAEVAVTSRDLVRGSAACDEIERASGKRPDLVELDLSSFVSIRRAAQRCLEMFSRIDVLINNAGLILSSRRETHEGFEQTLGVNHVGHFLFTQESLERIKSSAPARIVNVASAAHRRAVTGLDFDDLGATRSYAGLLVYSRSKLANIYFTRELARRLSGSGVSVNAVHPGTVGSRFARDGDAPGVVGMFFAVAKPLLLSAEQGAEALVNAAAAPELAGVTGQYLSRLKLARPSRVAEDDTRARRLWEATERWVAQGHP